MEVSGRKADQDRSVASGKIYHFCEPCQDEQVMTRANGLCRECKEYMCNTCFQHHLKARQCRNHVFLDASDQSASSHEGDGKAVKCKFHKNETIKYYCRKHDIVGCGDCMVLGHGACKPEFVKDLVKDFQENGVFRRFVGKLENLTSAIAESEKKIQDDMRENKTMYEIALKEIIKFRADINEYLDKAETDVITEVNRFKSENENLLVKLEKNCKELSCKIGKVKQVINAENCRGTSLFIHSVECKPDVLDIERALAQLKLKNNIEKITFVPDKQLFNIVASKTKLGEMAVPAFADVKQLSHATIDKTPDEKIQRKQLSETKEVLRSNAGVNGTHAMPVSKKDGEIVFETYYHQSGIEFQCIYQNETRYYLADSWEWLEFPEHWYIEGVLMTKSVLKDDSTENNYRKK